jgi:4-amino-4-deoxy-L-arabinose transferase-like glycosyltransferase
MTTNPSAPHARESNLLARHWGFFVVLAAMALAASIRMRLVDLPLERDEGEYAYAGQLMLQGIPPYQLAYNMKFPGTYAAYALIMAVFGESPIGIHLGIICLTTITTAILYWFGRKFFDETTGAIAGATYAILAASPDMLGLAGHATHFNALFVSAGLFFIWPRKDVGLIWPRAAGAGLMLGLAVLMKQHAAVFCLWGLLFVFMTVFRDRTSSPRVRWSTPLAFAIGVGLPFAVTCLLLAHAGVFDKFWFWTISYARHYASQIKSRNIPAQFWAGFSGIVSHTGWFWVVALVAPWFMSLRPEWIRERTRLGSFAVASILATFPSFIFRSHYFLVALPAIAVLVGCFFSALNRYVVEKFATSLFRFAAPAGFAVLVACTTFANRAIWFVYSRNEASRAVYGDNPFIESEKLAVFIRENSTPDMRVAVLGSEPQIYFLSNRHSATGYIYTYPLMEIHPFASRMQSEMIREIETTKPEMVVVVSADISWLIRKDSDLTIMKWWVDTYQTNYQAVAGINIGDGRTGKLTVFLRNSALSPASTNSPPVNTPPGTGAIRNEGQM